MNDRGLAVDLLQYDKVIEIPVQDARQLELIEMVEIELERAGAKLEVLGNVDHAAKADAFERHGKLSAQSGEVDMMAVTAGDHCETGEAAFCCLGLQDDGKLVSDSE